MAKLTARYLTSAKNLPAIMTKIRAGTPPDKFNVDHLKGLGFNSSNDRAIIPLLKDLGFLSADGTPTRRYHEYRGNPRPVMGEALRDAYAEIFHINEKPTKADREAIKGKFKTTAGSGDRVAEQQAATFLSLLDLADLNEADKLRPEVPSDKIDSDDHADTEEEREDRRQSRRRSSDQNVVQLRYNIELHLPPTKDIEVFNAIFKSLKEHLLEH